MIRVELIRVLLFTACVAAVFLAAAAFALDGFRRRKTAPGRLYLWARRASFSVAGLAVLCIAYGYFIEPYWLDVTRVAINSPKLPAGHSLRIAHFSDVHSDPKVRLEKKLAAALADARPDLIVFTGDSINSPEGLPNFKALLSEASRVAPTCVVKGNWDAWYWKDLDLFGGTGARELSVETVALSVKAALVTVSGAPVGREHEVQKLLGALPPETFNVFLFHYPDEIGEALRAPVDLYVAGHTHGGQVALPFYGALITFSQFGKRFEAGLYQLKNTWMYVNRGIGMEGGHAPRVRFWARPELTIIDVTGGEGMA